MWAAEYRFAFREFSKVTGLLFCDNGLNLRLQRRVFGRDEDAVSEPAIFARAPDPKRNSLLAGRPFDVFYQWALQFPANTKNLVNFRIQVLCVAIRVGRVNLFGGAPVFQNVIEVRSGFRVPCRCRKLENLASTRRAGDRKTHR